MTSLLQVRELTKTYPSKENFLAVDHISFDLKKGEILGFLGPNGSGKTTTIQMLLGTLLKTSGSIHYFGKDFSLHREEILQSIAFASTYLSLPYILTVQENLEVLGLLYGLSRKESRKRFEPLLERFNILSYLNQRVSALSAGQLTRLMMAKAFFIEPKIVLLDEPTASLDPDISQDICSFLLEQRDKTGLSILFTSHKMEEVAEVCDRVIFLDRGKIIADDLPENLAKKSSCFRLKLIIVDHLEKTIALATKKHLNYTSDHRSIEIELEEQDIPDFLHTLSLEGIVYTGIHIQEPSLDDYFLKIARGTR